MPYGYPRISVDLRQYTTSIPMTAGGSTAPMYFTVGGISFPLGKAIKDAARVAKVATATTAIIIKEGIGSSIRLASRVPVQPPAGYQDYRYH